MTLNALTVNREWNTRIVSTDQGEYTKEFTVPNTDKTAVEIEWLLDTPVR